MILGEFRIDVVRDALFRLDGGAMFGVVPKVLWERKLPADDANRVQLTTNCLLVRTSRLTVLIETGLGGRWSERERRIYGIEQVGALMGGLASLGVSPGAVDLVLLSHLHFDHVGGATALDEHGEAVPAFPNADYVVQRGELEHARAPSERDSTSYRAGDFEPLSGSGRLRAIDGDQEVAPGIRAVRVGGHSVGSQAFEIESEGRTACFFGDLVPTSAHVAVPWTTGYDLFPLDVLAEKRRRLAAARERGSVCAFVHDLEVPWGLVGVGPSGKHEAVRIDPRAEVAPRGCGA